MFFGLFTSCGYRNSNNTTRAKEKYLVESKGNPYEIVLVAPMDMHNGQAWDNLRSVLDQEVEMISRLEPMFDVVSTVPENLKNVLQQHRNIIILEIGEKYDSTSIKVEYDKYSKPQMLVYMTAPTEPQLTDYIKNNRNNIITLFNREEQKRMVEKMTKRNAPAINDTIMSMFGLSIQIPHGYKIRSVHDDFLWISYEAPQTSQGVFIYSYEYDPEMKFTQEYLLEMRNKFAALIPGPLDGGYMSTSTEYTPNISSVVINGREWIEQRGFWDVANDYMGGPFVSFSTLEKSKNRVLVIDEYLYSPQNHKPMRNQVRQLENIVYTAKL